MISCSTSQGPRSAPLRTWERGTGTRQAPYRQASHISSQEASKATDSPAITRSPGPIGSSGEEQRGLGVHEGGGVAVGDGDALGPAGGAGGEDDPGVVARAPGRRGGAAVGDVPVDGQRVPGAEHGAHAGLAEHQLGPLVGVLGVHRDVGGAGGEHGQDRDVEVVGAGRDPDADPVAERRPRRRPEPAQRPRPRRPARGRSAQTTAVVQRRLVRDTTATVASRTSTRVRGEAAGPPEKRAVSPSCARSSSSSRPRALLSCVAAIGPRVSIPEASGAPAGPQVCLGLSGPAP